MGIDTGTSGTKAVLIDEKGQILAQDTQEYSLSTPHPQWAEQHPEIDWWPAAQRAVRAVLAKVNVTGEQIGAVGLTGQMHGSVFLDKQGKVLRPALLWCDARTGEECAEITAKLGGKQGLFETIGQPVLTSYTAPKVLWVKKHEPEIYAKIAQVLLPKDYIRYKLTGEYAAEVSDASGTSLLDVRTRKWSQKMLTALDIPTEWMPKLYESPEITGVISSEAATLTGLKMGTPVVGGGGDQAAGAVGCGIVASGQVMSSLGTSGVIFAHSDEAFFDPEMRIQTYCHAVPGAWHLMGCVLSAGGALRWYRDIFRPGMEYDAVTSAAQNAPLGGEGLVFLPYLAGERTPHPNPNARGVFFGATLRSNQDYFARAVLEGVAFALADNVDLLRQVNVPVKQIRANGGGAKSPFWLQMMADVMNVTHITLNVDEGPAFGAALLASVGAGAYSSVPEACNATIHAVSETKSKVSDHLEYQKWHTLYRALYPSLQAHFDTVSQIMA